MGDTVLDPFMGSGTTLVATAAAGRAGIEIEIEKKYCELAQERIARPCSGPEGAHVPSRSGR
jgi:site-specific DNA-methyltransferase (adenine-specific)